MGLAGMFCSASALLIWLAFRGWSVLLLAPVAALMAAAFAGEPLLAHWTQTFMGSAARFLAQFFPLFLLGALFGKLMEDSGSVAAIARFMTERLGTQPRDAGRRAGRRAGHLWRRQPVRRLLRAGADGRGAVPRRRHPAPADAGGDRARHFHLHDVGTAGHAGDPERDPDAILRHDALRRAGPRCDRRRHHARLRPVVAGASRGRRRARRARASAALRSCPPTPRPTIRWCASVRRRRSEFDPAEISHGNAATAAAASCWRALPLAVVVAVNLLMSLRRAAAHGHRFPRRAALGRHLAVGGRRGVGGGGGAWRRPSSR